MWCPKCNNVKTKVIGTDKSAYVKRMRICPKCKIAYTTIELINDNKNLAAYRQYVLGELEFDEKNKNNKGTCPFAEKEIPHYDKHGNLI